ncbi:MAG: hypothetical protein M5U26_22500 [Planctomycetota bacterium]|nr:hypothetical protein [Planctomycetota bacterium]
MPRIAGSFATLLALTLCTSPARAGQAGLEPWIKNFVRFSANAKTASLKLNADAAAYIDLLFDYYRNREALAKPDHPLHHRGTWHCENKAAAEGVTFSVKYVVAEIAAAKLSFASVPALLKAALEPDFAEAVKTGADNTATLERARGALLTELSLCCPGFLDPASPQAPTRALREELIEWCFKEIGANSNLNKQVYKVLVQAGDEALALRALGLHATLRENSHPAAVDLASAVCAMRCKTGEDMLAKALEKTDDATAIAAFSILSDDLSAANYALLKKNFLSPAAAGQPSAATNNALSMLERIKSESARALLTEAFKESANENFKYGAACALLRMGSREPLDYLNELLRKLPATDGRSVFIKRLLENTQKNLPENGPGSGAGKAAP